MDDGCPTFDRVTFAYHRGIAPMAWTFFALAGIELVVVHALIALRWPWLAWPLSLLTGTTLVWLVFWIRSMARLPHVLDADGLLLRVGSLRRLHVPLRAIAEVRRNWAPGEHKGDGTRNLVPIAHPNRMLVVSAPLAGRRAASRVMIRLDDPVAFDAALAARDVLIVD